MDGSDINLLARRSAKSLYILFAAPINSLKYINSHESSHQTENKCAVVEKGAILGDNRSLEKVCLCFQGFEG
jgi:hypothetical protein